MLFAEIATSQDLKATLTSPNNGLIYEKTTAVSIAVEISNESSTVLNPNDSVLIRFYLDGMPLAIKQGNNIKTAFRDKPPYPLGGQDSSLYIFNLPQAVLMIDDTITGNRTLCAEVDRITGTDSNYLNNRSCINILVPPPFDTGGYGISFAAVLTPTGYVGNQQPFELYIQGGGGFDLKIRKPGYGDCAYQSQAIRDSALGTLFSGRLNLKHADTGKWDVLIMDGADVVYVMPAAYEVRRRSLTSVRPDTLAGFGKDTLYFSGMGLPIVRSTPVNTDSTAQGRLFLINDSDLISPLLVLPKRPGDVEYKVLNQQTRTKGGVYDFVLVLDNWDTLRLEKSVVLDPPEPYYDFRISGFNFGTNTRYKSGTPVRFSTAVYYDAMPGAPMPDTLKSVAFHFSLNGSPLLVKINDVLDSVHTLTGKATSYFSYTFDNSYFLFDSSAQGDAEICITIQPLYAIDTVLQNNRICKTFTLTPASPDVHKPTVQDVNFKGLNDFGIHAVNIVGKNLPANSDVRLFRSGGQEIRNIDSLNVSSDSARLLTVYFNLNEVDTGAWDMVIALPGADTFLRSGAVYIKSLRITRTRADTLEQRGHKEIHFAVNGTLKDALDFEVLIHNGIDSFTLDRLKVTRSTHDTSAVFSVMSYPYQMPVGIYDLILRMKDRDLIQNDAVRVIPRRPSDSISVLTVSGQYVSINRMLLKSSDEGNVFELLLKNHDLQFGDSIQLYFIADSIGYLFRRDGREDSVFRIRVDTSNAKIRGVGVDSILFTALVPDGNLRSFTGRNYCLEVTGLNFSNHQAHPPKILCTPLIGMMPPSRGELRIVNETIGNKGTMQVRIMGEENWTNNYGLSLHRPGYPPIDLPNWYLRSIQSGNVYEIAVYADNLYLGDWELVAGTQDTAIKLRKQIKVMQSAIRPVGPRRFGIQSGSQFEWTVLVRTEYIDTGLGNVWLTLGSSTIYADQVKKVAGQHDLYSIRFKSTSPNLIAGTYDMTVSVRGTITPFVLKEAIILEPPVEEELSVKISGPSEVRPGFWQPYLVQVTNPSNIEVPGVIIPFATTYDSVTVEGLDVMHVQSDSFNGAIMGDWRAGVLALGRMGPQETRSIRLKAVTHRALTEPAKLQVGLFSIASTRDADSGPCLAPNLSDWLGLPAHAIAPACLSNALQQPGEAGVMDFAAAVTDALVSCGIAGVPDSLRALVTRALVARGADRHADSCDALYRPISSYHTVTDVLWSYDPNDKYGPRGAGPHNYFDTGRKEIDYTIRFENDSSASAPAQIVRIVDTIDKSVYDMSSFRLGDVWVADSVVLEGGGRMRFDHYKDFDMLGRSFVLHVKAALDTSTGVAEWTLTTLDKHTMELTSFARGGFLPPNIISTEGQGSVSFSIRLKDKLPHDVPIRNRAYIYFDINPPIITDEFENRIDAKGPSSLVQSLPPYILDDSTLRLRWDGTDSGSGIWSYSLFVSKNGAGFEEWINTTEKEIVFTGDFGSTYAFYSVATDSVGNSELPPATHDAITTFIRCSDVLSLMLDTSGPLQFCKGGQVSLSVTGGQYYSWNNGADSAVIHIAQTGVYQVTITDTFGCMLQSDTVFTTVFDLPQAPVIRRSADTLYSDKASGNQWYRNADKLEGATGSFYRLSLPGSYKVAYTDSNGCISLSEEVMVTENVSVTQVPAGRTISVYPNPSEIFTITGEAGAGAVRIMVFDMQGKLIVQEQKAATGSEFLYRLDLSAYPPAAYWLYVQSGTAYYSGKVVRP